MDRSMYNTTSNVDISTYNNRFTQRNTSVQLPLNIQNNTCMSGIITLQQQQLMNLQQPQLLNLQQPQVLNLQQQQQQHLNLQQPQQYPMLMQKRMMMELNTVSMPQTPVHNTMTVTKKKRKQGQNQKEKRTKSRRN